MNAGKAMPVIGWTLYGLAFPFLIMIVGVGIGFAVGLMLLAIPVAAITMPAWLPVYTYLKEVWPGKDPRLQAQADDQVIIAHLVEAYRARLLRVSNARAEIAVQAPAQQQAACAPVQTKLLATSAFGCSLCKHVADVVNVVRRSTGYRLERWSTSSPIEEDVLDAHILTLRRGDARGLYALNRDYAPFYCPTCNAVFCKKHWLIWQDFDAGLRDCVKGTCPNGHTRMLEG